LQKAGLSGGKFAMDKQELEKLIKEKEYLFLKEKLEKTNEVDIAELLEPLDIHTTLLIFRMLPKEYGEVIHFY
jgi:magnesium transporter